MTDIPEPVRPGTVIGCLPDVPERVRPGPVIVCRPAAPGGTHRGGLPANVDVRLVPPEPEPVPDLAEVDLVVPHTRNREPLLALLAGPTGRLRVIQTLSAGVDW